MECLFGDPSSSSWKSSSVKSLSSTSMSSSMSVDDVGSLKNRRKNSSTFLRAYRIQPEGAVDETLEGETASVGDTPVKPIFHLGGGSGGGGGGDGLGGKRIESKSAEKKREKKNSVGSSSSRDSLYSSSTSVFASDAQSGVDYGGIDRGSVGSKRKTGAEESIRELTKYKEERKVKGDEGGKEGSRRRDERKEWWKRDRLSDSF